MNKLILSLFFFSQMQIKKSTNILLLKKKKKYTSYNNEVNYAPNHARLSIPNGCETETMKYLKPKT